MRCQIIKYTSTIQTEAAHQTDDFDLDSGNSTAQGITYHEW